MYTKLILLVFLAALTFTLFLTGGCDKLTTQVNNNTYYDSTLAEACLACHGDANPQIVVPKGQWANSAHASADLIQALVIWDSVTYLTSNCGPRCHTSQGFQQYASTKTASSQAHPSVIDCFTCHMPHTGAYGSWRLDTLRGYFNPISLPDSSEYSMGKSAQCAICHQAATYTAIGVGTSGRFPLDSLGPDGPHSGADAEMVLGVSGYLFGTSQDSSAHKPVAGKDGCLACHYGAGNYGTGRGNQFAEHTFRLRDTLTNEQFTDNCNVAGCHSGTLVTDFFASDSIKAIAGLADSLGTRLLAMHLLLSRTNASRDTVPTDGARIVYNYLLVKQDKSRGVHNPQYSLNLLHASLGRLDSVPVASFTAPETTCINQSVTFTSTSTGAITTTTWDYGDGTSPTTDNIKPFTKPDSFMVKLSVSGTAGTAIARHYILVDTLPKAAFTKVVGTAPDSLTVTFTNASTHRFWKYLWNFGDGIGTTTATDTTYTYAASGKYGVTLKVTNACGDVDSLVDTVRVPTPVNPVRRP